MRFESQTHSLMKTLLIILVTLAASQYICHHYGSHNILTQATDACVGAVRWVLHAMLHLLK